MKGRGYASAWIALLDESGKLATYAESGLGKSFLPMVEHLKRGEMPACGQRALKQSEAVVTEDPASTCTDCPLSSNCAGRSAAGVRLEYDGEVYGLLSVGSNSS
ncbi:MAG: GAF domain-containing protein [Dehalococcoidia bacterium]|nr:GAF domain-containing protein [Dehalococcoidia bacterium]